jgi:hypothetical protein
MFYEKMTKHKIQLNSAKYKDDIKKIMNAMLKEEKTFEHYDFFKEDYDIFINSILGKLIAINTLPMIIELDEPLAIDKTIFIQKNKKSIIEMMIKKENVEKENDEMQPLKLETLKTEILKTETLNSKPFKQKEKAKNKKLKLDV